MIATSGDNLLEPEAIESYKNKLFPLATLITPNLDEAISLLGTTIEDQKQMENAAKALAKKYGTSILLKGGHLPGENAIDFLFHQGQLTEFSAPFVRDVETHGTAARIRPQLRLVSRPVCQLEQAIKRAKKFVTSRSGDISVGRRILVIFSTRSGIRLEAAGSDRSDLKRTAQRPDGILRPGFRPFLPAFQLQGLESSCRFRLLLTPSGATAKNNSFPNNL